MIHSEAAKGLTITHAKSPRVCRVPDADASGHPNFQHDANSDLCPRLHGPGILILLQSDES